MTKDDKASSESLRLILVVFLGGCTFSEISALRFLGREKGENRPQWGAKGRPQEGFTGLWVPPATILLGAEQQGARFHPAWQVAGPESMVLVHLGLQTGALTQPGLWNWRDPTWLVSGAQICPRSHLVVLLLLRVQVHFSDDSGYQQCPPHGGHERGESLKFSLPVLMSFLDVFLSGMQESDSELLRKCLPTTLLRAGEQGTFLGSREPI